MITTARTTLAADLAAVGVPVHTTWPDRISPPCVLLVPPQAGSYVTSGDTFRTYTLALDVLVFTDRGSFELMLPILETLIAAVLANSEDWQLTGVDAPGVTVLGGSELFGSTVHLAKQIQP